jgi:hypothetical protein
VDSHFILRHLLTNDLSIKFTHANATRSKQQQGSVEAGTTHQP